MVVSVTVLFLVFRMPGEPLWAKLFNFASPHPFCNQTAFRYSGLLRTISPLSFTMRMPSSAYKKKSAFTVHFLYHKSMILMCKGIAACAEEHDAYHTRC
jgi:hypothetical protein